MDGTSETIEDTRLAGQLRLRGRKIRTQALLAAVALTATVLLLPS